MADTERAWWYADGIETWVKSILMIDAQNSKIDSLGEGWAKPVDYLPVAEGGLRGGIIDLQGRFNLNNLSVGANGQDPRFIVYKAQFERLVQNIDALKNVPVEGLAEAIHDWTDADDQPMGFGGAEDSEYTTLVPPYRAANRPMTSVSELLAIKGVTKQIYLGLRDYVCALPVAAGPTAINVNTAPAPVLLSLAPQASSSLAQFLESRVDKPTDNARNWWADMFPGAGVPGQNAPAVTESSEYFLLHGEAFIGSSHLALYSVIYRPKQNGSLPAVISRSQDID
jgi:general secretion pathway protein K